MPKNILLVIQSLIIIFLIGLLINVYSKYEACNNKPIITDIISNSENKQTKNLLVIGNSISVHGICEYWWGQWGMAASSRDKDYVHVLVKKMSNNQNVKYSIINFCEWEVNSHDRSEFLDQLKPALRKTPDYVIVQLGENISDAQSLAKDFNALIDYIKNNDKNANIIVIGNFWKNKKVDKIKMDVCLKNNIKFINLKDIQDNDQYCWKIGSMVDGDDKNEHIIEHKGVAKHPNDNAMEYIADKIYKCL